MVHVQFTGCTARFGESVMWHLEKPAHHFAYYKQTLYQEEPKRHRSSLEQLRTHTQHPQQTGEARMCGPQCPHCACKASCQARLSQPSQDVSDILPLGLVASPEPLCALAHTHGSSLCIQMVLQCCQCCHLLLCLHGQPTAPNRLQRERRLGRL